MKKTLKNVRFIFSIVVILAACYVIIELKGRDFKEIKQIKRDTYSVGPYQSRDLEEIKAHFQQFPHSYDKIVKYEVPVITASIMTNKEMVKDFYQKYQKGKQGSLDMITFGIEGGIICHYIQYNGQDLFYCCFGDEINDIVETFQNCYLFDVPEGYLDGFDASKVSEPFQELVLSTVELSDFAAYERLDSKIVNMDEVERKNEKTKIEGFRISPFQSKEELKQNCG